MPGFHVVFFPKCEFDDEEGQKTNSVWKELRSIKKKHKNKHKKLMQILKLLQHPDNGNKYYDSCFNNGVIYSMSKECKEFKSKPLYEIRHPKRSATGVIRAYFCHSRHEHKKLVVLNVEHKTITKGNTTRACNNRADYWSNYDQTD